MEDDYFDDIPDEKIPKDMLDLASHIVNTKAGRFDSDKFEDQYEVLSRTEARETADAHGDRRTSAPSGVLLPIV
jgi:non-homologous end joining protein Ku